MDFLHTYPNAKLIFFVGTMQLMVESNAAYLVLSGSKSHSVGHFYLASFPKPLNYNKSPNNAPVLTECKTLRNVDCSATETKCGGVYNMQSPQLRFTAFLKELDTPRTPPILKPTTVPHTTLYTVA